MLPAGPYFASAGDSIKIWDTKTLEVVKQYNFHKGNVKDLSWSRNNNFLCSVSSTGDKIILSDCFLSAKDKPKIIAEHGVSENQTCVRVSPRDKSIYTAGVSGDVNIWETETGKLKKSYKNTHNEPVTCISLNIFESHFASGSNKGDVVIRNLSSDVVTKPTNQKSGQAVRGMTFSPWKYSLLGMAMDDGSLNLWDTLHSKVHCNFSEIHKAPAMDVVFSTVNDMLMASVGLDKSMIVYDYKNHKFLNKIILDQPLTSLTFGHDGVTLYAGSSLGQIYQLDLRSLNQAKKQVTGHSTSVQRVTIQNQIKVKDKKHSNSHKSKVIHQEDDITNSTKKPSTNISNKMYGKGEGDELNKFTFSPYNKTKASPEILTNGLPNGNHPSKPPETSYTASTPAPNLPYQQGFEGVLSPLQDDTFGHVSFPSVGGSFNMTGTTFTSSVGDYCDDVLSPLGSSSKPAMQRTPNPGLQIHSRTSPHPLRQSYNTGNSTPVNPTKKHPKNITEPETSSVTTLSSNIDQLKLPQTGVGVQNNLKSQPRVHVANEHLPSSASSSSSVANSSSRSTVVNETVTNATIQPIAMTQVSKVSGIEFQNPITITAVKDLIDELGDNIRQQHNENLSQMVKLFLQHEEIVRQTIENRECGINNQLLMEIERLKEENEMLRRIY